MKTPERIVTMELSITDWAEISRALQSEIRRLCIVHGFVPGKSDVPEVSAVFATLNRVCKSLGISIDRERKEAEHTQIARLRRIGKSMQAQRRAMKAFIYQRGMVGVVPKL